MSDLPDTVVSNLSEVFNKELKINHAAITHDHLLWVFQKIANAYAVEVDFNIHLKHQGTLREQLEEVSEETQFRIRETKLSPKWWQNDCGILLVIDENNGKPWPIVPDSNGVYWLIQEDESKIKLTENLAKNFNTAFMVYRPFLKSRITGRDILKTILKLKKKMLIDVVGLQVFINLLALLIPIGTGILMDHVIPEANYHLLTQLTTILVITVFVNTLFRISQTITMIRLKLTLNATLQPSIWDRLFRLPLRFIRQYTAGDLANRAAGLDQIQQLLTSNTLQICINGFLSVISFALMLYYSWTLTLLAVVITVLISAISLIGILFQLPHLREQLNLNGVLFGFLFQVINHIEIIRQGNRHIAALTKWSTLFGENVWHSFRSNIIGMRIKIIANVFTIISTLLLFVLVFYQREQISFGTFIAFNAVYTQFFLAISAMIGMVSSILNLIPTYERIKPILTAAQASGEGYGLKPTLNEAITIKDLSFRYREDLPDLFHHLSLTFQPGKTTAIIGQSGQGKSTIIRILLGLEEYHEGEITYGSYDLKKINLTWLRQQIGVVTQESQLLPGTLLENILGNHFKLTEDDAWRAAKLAAIDKEIEALPMRMQTTVANLGNTFSTGQKQRLLLAKALVHQPSLLMLDEATSNIDNQTQKQIQENLKLAHVTQIIITHRLRVIEYADYIYVIHAGKVIEEGHFQDLACEKSQMQQILSY